MKRNIIHIILVTFLIIIATQFSYAISTEIKDSYLPKETIITEISGSIIDPIATSNVELKRGHILVPIDYDVKKLGDKYYLWAIAPEQQANYTLFIKDITSYVSGRIEKVDYEKNFSVSGNLIDYYAKPGFASTDKDFEIKVTLNEDNNKEIKTEFLEEGNFTLKPGENIIKFSISGINESNLFGLEIGKYNIPVYVRVNKSSAISLIRNITNLTAIDNITEILDFESLTEEEKEEVNEKTSKYRCVELFSGGKICAADEKCSGDIIVSLDGPCCVGANAACVKSKEGGGSAWIGYLIAAIVIIAGIFTWIKYKKVKAEENPVARKLEKKNL